MREIRLTLVCACFAIVAMTGAAGAEVPTDYPLEPPDRSSPRATLTTFLESVDEAWGLYSTGKPGYGQTFRVARESLDLSEIPPLVYREMSAEAALFLKGILDRLEMPADDEIPDAAAVAALGLVRWSVPHTEITLLRVADGEREGQWLFSKGTVARASEFYERAHHLPLRPGKLGGHVDKLRSGSEAIVLMRLADVMPPWFRSEVGGMLIWQWFGRSRMASTLVLAGAA